MSRLSSRPPLLQLGSPPLVHVDCGALLAAGGGGGSIAVGRVDVLEAPSHGFGHGGGGGGGLGRRLLADRGGLAELEGARPGRRRVARRRGQAGRGRLAPAERGQALVRLDAVCLRERSRLGKPLRLCF